MPILNRIADRSDEIALWRRHLHAHPELQYDTHLTAAFVADRLRAFGVDEVVTGIGRTGVVAVIRGGRGTGQTIGLRADMDALPIEEATGRAWSSTVAGKMHACGHDGHSAMLLGAAQHLAETRNFAGTAVVIFQPAEEGGGGAKAMIDDGLMERFGIDAVYGMHNMPGIPVGSFAIRAGGLLASADTLEVEIEGVGGHAAFPHDCTDTVLAGAAVVQAVQQIVARNVDPLKSAVISITCFNAGFTDNVIPQTARLLGTVRALDPGVRDLLEKRLNEVVPAAAAAYGATARVTYRREYPVTVNHARETAFAAEVAGEVAGAANVDADRPPEMGAEDFSFMLEKRPGAMIFVGNGDSAQLHHPAYDFDDAAIPAGASYWVRLVEKALPAT
ncbi:M20 aminoacylase family protein [Pseudoxanthobacter sp. M-2]|uniref:M20 aminoacylase family protein n=1 Tax=Pseudoxanthobacter sp. M-2 TaxID=3078754 RepID=UPI0038FC15D5